MTKPITDSTAYVGRYADGTSWPWWAFVLLVPMLLIFLPISFLWFAIFGRR